MDASRTSWRPAVVAHRGCWLGSFAENSRGAFARAVELGFPAECDVHGTRDGELVVMHDDRLDRTTTAAGLVSNFTAGELQHIRLKKLDGRLDEPPPLLRDVADLVSLVEVKPPDARPLVQRVLDIMGGRGEWLLQSFDPRNIEHALELNSATRVALLVERAAALKLALANGWTVHVDHRLLDERIAGVLHDGGVRFGVWTVNTEEDLRRVLPLRPDVIISDQPVLMRELIARS
jgi:glycerophosphoryl diester phosphodiesterase